MEQGFPTRLVRSPRALLRYGQGSLIEEDEPLGEVEHTAKIDRSHPEAAGGSFLVFLYPDNLLRPAPICDADTPGDGPEADEEQAFQMQVDKVEPFIPPSIGVRWRRTKPTRQGLPLPVRSAQAKCRGSFYFRQRDR